MTALSGIRVVEIADESGAFCGRLLADMGADVVKVEPTGGDRARTIGPFFGAEAHPDRSLFFWHYNAGKRSVVLDREGEGGAAANDLIDAADVLVVTGSPSELGRRGLAPAALRRGRPSLIVVAISPFGQTGPRRDWRSCDLVAQAAGGMLWVNGHRDEPPLRAYGLQAYHCAGLQAAIGTVLALLARERSGRGQLVDVSLQESVVAALEHVAASFHSTGRVESRRGTLHWAGGFRVCRCRDGLVCCSSVGDWTALVEWVKASASGDDLVGPEWESLPYRLEHGARLFDALERWTRGRTVAELSEGARLRRLPFAPLLSPRALPQHPQLRERGFFRAVEHEDLGVAVPYPGVPFRFGNVPRRAPRAGEHGAEARAELERERDARRPRGSGEAGSPDAVAAARVLAGVRIVDLTWVVAGPAATRILADHGADVIKVERPDAVSMPNRRDGLTGNLNRGKRSIVVDLATARGRALLADLVRAADVMIDNFAPRVLPNWGLDDDALRVLNPNVIAVHMSAFGRDGPWRNDVAYGPTLQALAGHTRQMRHPGGEPAGWGFSFSDMASASYAAFAILLALRHRRRTGVARIVDLAQFEALASLNGPDLLADALAAPHEPVLGNGSAEGPAAPHGVYRCRDRAGRERWCALAVFDDEEWRLLVEALGAPDWATAAELRDGAGRITRRDEIDAALSRWTAVRDAEEVAEQLQTRGVAAAVVADAEDLCRRDPQLLARDYWTRVRTPQGDTVTLDGVLPRLSDTAGAVTASAPLAGEHTDEILRDVLSLSPAEIAALRRDHIVA